MAQIQSVLDLNEESLEFLIEELSEIDPLLREKVDFVLSKSQFSIAEALEYLVLQSPAIFGKVYLNWESRDYQSEILKQGREVRKLVLRLGRRLGKTETMCILILFYAYTQLNIADEEKIKPSAKRRYRILIIAPFEEQVDLIFDRLHQLIDSSPIFDGMIRRDVHHRIELKNGSVIKGLTAGSKSNTGAASTRGQGADVIVLDEVDYMGSSEITNVINISNEDPSRIKIIAASTPCGKREEYYKWCTGATRRFKPRQEDIDNHTFTAYETEKTQHGNGWTEIYAPSTVNKVLLEMNPDTDQTYLEDIKAELTEMRYIQEVLAEFGEELQGVYQKRFIDFAVKQGIELGHIYVDDPSFDRDKRYALMQRGGRPGPLILGVDWDKYGAATNMVCLMMDRIQVTEDGVSPKFRIMFRTEIPRGEFTYTKAVNKIVELNDAWDFDFIAVDRGYGETQIELLHKYGLENPTSGLDTKVVGYQFGQKIDVYDPHTKQVDKKPLKPFMVNNSVLVFEKGGIIFDPRDRKMVEQFEGYRIKNISPNGIPTYTDENEHIVDAVNLALLIFEQNFGFLFKQVTTNKILSLNGKLNNPGGMFVRSEDRLSNIFSTKRFSDEESTVRIKNYGYVSYNDAPRRDTVYKGRSSF